MHSASISLCLELCRCATASCVEPRNDVRTVNGPASPTRHEYRPGNRHCVAHRDLRTRDPDMNQLWHCSMTNAKAVPHFARISPVNDDTVMPASIAAAAPKARHSTTPELTRSRRPESDNSGQCVSMSMSWNIASPNLTVVDDAMPRPDTQAAVATRPSLPRRCLGYPKTTRIHATGRTAISNAASLKMKCHRLDAHITEPKSTSSDDLIHAVGRSKALSKLMISSKSCSTI